MKLLDLWSMWGTVQGAAFLLASFSGWNAGARFRPPYGGFLRRNQLALATFRGNAWGGKKARWETKEVRPDILPSLRVRDASSSVAGTARSP